MWSRPQVNLSLVAWCCQGKALWGMIHCCAPVPDAPTDRRNCLRQIHILCVRRSSVSHGSVHAPVQTSKLKHYIPSRELIYPTSKKKEDQNIIFTSALMWDMWSFPGGYQGTYHLGAIQWNDCYDSTWNSSWWPWWDSRWRFAAPFVAVSPWSVVTASWAWPFWVRNAMESVYKKGRNFENQFTKQKKWKTQWNMPKICQNIKETVDQRSKFDDYTVFWGGLIFQLINHISECNESHGLFKFHQVTVPSFRANRSAERAGPWSCRQRSANSSSVMVWSPSLSLGQWPRQVVTLLQTHPGGLSYLSQKEGMPVDKDTKIWTLSFTIVTVSHS